MSTKMVIGGMVEVPKPASGGTIPNTTNLLKGDGAGNAAATTIAPSNVSLLSTLPADLATASAASPAAGTFTGLLTGLTSISYSASDGSGGLNVTNTNTTLGNRISGVYLNSNSTYNVGFFDQFSGPFGNTGPQVVFYSSNSVPINFYVGGAATGNTLFTILSSGGVTIYNGATPSTPVAGVDLFVNGSNQLMFLDASANTWQIAPQDLSSGANPTFAAVIGATNVSAGGVLNMQGGPSSSQAGGSVLVSGTSNGAGGSIITQGGGGTIDTTGTGSIQLGIASTRTTITGTANAARAISFPNASGVVSLLAADTGWTANSTVGDKTAVIVAYSAGLTGTMITALNTVSAGTGTALQTDEATIALLVKKVAALETALAANLRPNL